MVDTLKIINKTVNDTFNLQDFIDDLNALNGALTTLKGLIDTDAGLINSNTNNINDAFRTINENYQNIKNNSTAITSLIQSVGSNESRIDYTEADVLEHKRQLSSINETVLAINNKLNETKTFVRTYYGTDTPVLAGAWTDLVFPAITMDTLGEYNSTNGTITIKNPGIYVMNCTILFSKAVPGGQYFLEAVVGGVGNRFAGAKWGTNTSFMLLSGSLTINVTDPNTTLKIRAFASSADTILGGTSYSFLQLARVN